MRSLFHQILTRFLQSRAYVGERALMRNDRNTCWFRESSTSQHPDVFRTKIRLNS